MLAAQLYGGSAKSPMPKLRAASKPDRAFQLHREIVEIGKITEQLHYFEIARRLYEIKANGLFKTLQYASFNAYLHDNELPFPATVGHALVKMHEQLVVKAKVGEKSLREIGHTKATVIARAAEGRELTQKKVKDLVAEAKVHSVPTFRSRVREEITGIPYEKCEHEKDRMFLRCPDCGRIRYIDPTTMKPMQA